MTAVHHRGLPPALAALAVAATLAVSVTASVTRVSPPVTRRTSVSCLAVPAITPTPACPNQASSAPAGVLPQPAAGDRLRQLADRLTDSAADRQNGSFRYLHLRRWILDTTGFPAPRPNTAAVIALDLHRWIAVNGTAVEVATEVGPDYQLTGADPNHRSTNAEFAGHRPKRVVYSPDQTIGPLRTPLATDPAHLARQLDVDMMPDHPTDTLNAVETLLYPTEPNRTLRAAALRMLADLPGLTYHPTAVDRAGRTGIATCLHHHNIRHCLTLAPTTGDLLAAEQQLTGPHDYLPIPAGRTVYYTLYLDHGRRTAPDQRAPGATTPADQKATAPHHPRIHSGRTRRRT